MKSILVPCDFSTPANQAFKFAMEIAQASNGEVFLLNVIEMPVLHNSMFTPVGSYESSYLKLMNEKAVRNFKKMTGRYANSKNVKIFVRKGRFLSTVQSFVIKQKIDLIVMGTHGASGLTEFMIGSNTEKIVRHLSVPVIAVKKAPALSSVRDIIFPTSLTISQKKLVTSVKALQTLFKARLHLLFVNTPADFRQDTLVEKRLTEIASQNQLKNFSIHIFNDIDADAGIIHFSARFKSKIIALGTHARKGLSHLFSGSVTEDVVNHIDCPIWTYSEK